MIAPKDLLAITLFALAIIIPIVFLIVFRGPNHGGGIEILVFLFFAAIFSLIALLISLWLGWHIFLLRSAIIGIFSGLIIYLYNPAFFQPKA